MRATTEAYNCSCGPTLQEVFVTWMYTVKGSTCTILYMFSVFRCALIAYFDRPYAHSGEEYGSPEYNPELHLIQVWCLKMRNSYVGVVAPVLIGFMQGYHIQLHWLFESTLVGVVGGIDRLWTDESILTRNLSSHLLTGRIVTVQDPGCQQTHSVWLDYYFVFEYVQECPNCWLFAVTLRINPRPLSS